MVSLKSNLRNRISKLKKPSKPAEALQPLFETISNSFLAIRERKDANESFKGRINISVENLKDQDPLSVEISDNGWGLDDDRYDAFCTIDTDFRKAQGGKGVGRLFWLDAFSEIIVKSSYKVGGNIKSRGFRFTLDNENQIEDIEHTSQTLGTTVKFTGLRTEAYQKQFPKKADIIHQHFISHFIAYFLSNGIEVHLTIDGETKTYPVEVERLIVHKMEKIEFDMGELGTFSLWGFLAKKEMSARRDGKHFLHLLAHNRNVESRKIDDLLGIDKIEHQEHQDLVFHGCLSGKYLDENVDEGRTAFQLENKVIEKISKSANEQIKGEFLKEQVEKYKEFRRGQYREFISRYPIYGFDDEETQLDRIKFASKKSEAFAADLAPNLIRREEARREEINAIVKSIENGKLPKNFDDQIVQLTQDLQQSERESLAHHAARRKLVLDIMQKLIGKLPSDQGTHAHAIEKTLHSLIVPMGISGSDPNSIEESSHDLWLINEELVFTTAFSSDERIQKILSSSCYKDRPDLILWDLSYGMFEKASPDCSQKEELHKELSKVMIVEFKRPGREEYQKKEDNIEQQITKYIQRFQNQEIETFGREKQRVRIAKDCQFRCYVIADIVGELKHQLGAWTPTANGQGRMRILDGDMRGSFIEVIQWQDLVNNARLRNQALLHAGGFTSK